MVDHFKSLYLRLKLMFTHRNRSGRKQDLISLDNKSVRFGCLLNIRNKKVRKIRTGYCILESPPFCGLRVLCVSLPSYPFLSDILAPEPKGTTLLTPFNKDELPPLHPPSPFPSRVKYLITVKVPEDVSSKGPGDYERRSFDGKKSLVGTDESGREELLWCRCQIV